MKKITKRSVFALFLPLLGSVLLCGTAFAAVELARVNGKVITLEEFNKKYQELLPLLQTKIPSRQTVLEDMIKREAGVQEARRLKLDQDPAVQDELESVLFQALLRKQLAKDIEKIQITDSDARAIYTKSPDVRTSHIFIAVAPGATKEEEAVAQKTLKDIQTRELSSGKSFSEVAQKFSEGVAAPMGGDIDYQSKAQLDPTYYSTALSLRTPGKVSGIVRSQFGYHIIKLTAIRPWNEVDPSVVKQEIFNSRKQSLFDRYVSGLRSKAQVQVKNNLIK